MTHLLLLALVHLPLAQARPEVVAPPPEPLVPAEVAVPGEPGEAEETKAPREETGNDALGDGEPSARLTFRTLTQVRYGGMHVFPGSLAHEGTIGEVSETPLTGPAVALASDIERHAAGDAAGYKLNRAFLRIVAKPSPGVDFKLLMDFAELMHKNPKRTLKLAYMDLKPWKRVHITAGLFKRTFSLLELLPIAQFELADSGPTDNFLKNLGFAGRDVGAMIQARPFKKKLLTLWVAAFGGDVSENFDSNPGKLITARAESEPNKHWRFGADVAWRPWDNVEYYDKGFNAPPPQAVLTKGWATSADITLHLAQFEARAEALLGTRTDVDDPYYPSQKRRGDARRFQGVWMLATYRLHIGELPVMPAARVEWLDGDSKRSNGGLLYVSGGLNFDLTRNLRLLVDLSYQNAQPQSRGYDDVSFLDKKYTYYPYLVDFTLLTVQLQLLL
jgi:hypothetical protein